MLSGHAITKVQDVKEFPYAFLNLCFMRYNHFAVKKFPFNIVFFKDVNMQNKMNVILITSSITNANLHRY